MATSSGTWSCYPRLVPAAQPGDRRIASAIVAEHLVWIDCEMTGLDLRRDALIEVAVLVTDADLNPVDAGLDVVIHVADDVLDAMIPYVLQMHASSGLTEQVRRATTTLGEAEKTVLDYVRRHVPEPKTSPLCGNSIATDRGFLARDMPALDAYLHYRMIDVSSIKELAKRWYPKVYQSQPQKGLSHRALADIQESVQELRFYRETLFVAQPGPSMEQAQAVARVILGDAGEATPDNAGAAPATAAPIAADGGAGTLDRPLN